MIIGTLRVGTAKMRNSEIKVTVLMLPSLAYKIALER